MMDAKLQERIDQYRLAVYEIKTKIDRCISWEAFNHLGLPQLCQLYCDSDHAYIKAFNPHMKLIRTKVIANGDDYCDHIWALET